MDNKRCITIDEISLTDGSDSAVTSSGFGKRRKFDVRDQENCVVQSKNDRLCRVNMNSSVSSTESYTCGHVMLGFSGETSQSSEICLDSDKTELFSRMTMKKKKKKPAPPRAVTSRHKPQATSAKLPTAAEIEDFFSVAEKKEEKRFSDKYNFDIVNDVPMDGRYQWVRLTVNTD